MRVAFWAATALVAWTYAVFPALTLVLGRLRPRPVRAADVTPNVTVIVAAHDEEAVIGARIENLLATDYPAERREIVVASDGSTDGTVERARRYEDRGVRVLDLPRVGKAAALDEAVRASSGEILVFTDANSEFEPGALRALVRPLADPAVGGVAGDQRYRKRTDLDGGDDGAGERTYWDLDRLLKVAESRMGSVVSATGAIHALRRELYRPVPPDSTDDFALSTLAVVGGRRLVFAPDAVAWEAVAPAGRAEFARKVRIITRGLTGVVHRRELLDPRRTGWYAVELLTHKVLRRLMVLPLAAIAVASPALWRHGPLYRLATVAQGAFYGLAGLGLALGGTSVGRHRLLAFPAFFVAANVAALRAAVNVATGRRVVRWDRARDGVP